MSREVVLNGQRLEDATRAANELATALCAGATRDERDALWRHARALIELNLTLAAGEPVNPGHSVRVPEARERVGLRLIDGGHA